jgi:hypothetical protein
MLPQNAIVLHAFDPGSASAGNSLFVNHFILQPQIWNLQPNHSVHNRWNVLRSAENIYEIKAVAGLALRSLLRGIKISMADKSENLTQRRIHRKNAIPVLDKIAANVMTRAPQLIAHANDSDIPRVGQYLVNDGWIVHFPLSKPESLHPR